VLKGLYRVCVAKDGHVSLVAALEPAADADPYVKEGIAQAWEYKPLPKPACFVWRVTLNFNLGRSMIPRPPALDHGAVHSARARASAEVTQSTITARSAPAAG
jgi:hypothetical protein